MSRLAVRRKADDANLNSDNNNNSKGELSYEPKPKNKRMGSQLPLAERPNVVGRALVCGQGDMGQLGLGDDDSKFERKRPALLENIKNVVDVKAGGMHNLILTAEGQVWSFGCNDEGALGRDSSEEGSEFEPKQIDLPGKVVKISAGDSHSACLLEDGSVFAWGSFRDSHGNMGLTLEGNKRLPIDVLPGKICVDIASGADHLVILTNLCKVFTVGCGEQGQLGRVSLRSASGEGRRGKTELLQPGEVVIRRGKLIEHIWATTYCTFLRERLTGTIWAFGLNNYKQMAYAKELPTVINPINTKFQDVKEIAGGQHHTLILKNDGSVLVIGRRDYGRLGLGTVAEDVTELKTITALKGKKVVSISCGEAQSFAITEDGKLYSWGMGSNHQLGTGSEDDALEPVLIVSKQTEGKRILKASSGGQHSIFLVEDENQPTIAQNKNAAANKKKETAKNVVKPAEKEQPKKASNKVDEDNTVNEKVEETNEKVNDADSTEAAEAKPAAAANKKGRKKK